MTLQVQIQTLVMSFVMGLIYGFVYSFYNRCVFRITFKILRYVLEVIFHLLFVTVYFYLMLYLNHGYFYIYHLIAMFLGLSFYLLFLYRGYLRMVEKSMFIFHWIFLPFIFSFKKIRVILKDIKKVRKHGNKKKKSQ